MRVAADMACRASRVPASPLLRGRARRSRGLIAAGRRAKVATVIGVGP